MKRNILLFLIITLVLLAGFQAYAQPANDNFANATVLSGTSTSTSGNSSGATRETGEPSIISNYGGRSVWFSWTAPVNGTTRIDTAGSGFNTMLGVYTGSSVSALSLVVSNDNGAGLGNLSLVTFPAVQGTTYRIAIDGRRNFGGSVSSGNYNLNLQVQYTLRLSSPANGSIHASGAPITLNTEVDLPGQSVARMDFYRNSSLVGSDTVAPYSIVTTDSPLGTNRFYVVATDSASQVWTSAVVNVLVVKPGVTILSPADGTTFMNANPITVTAVGLPPAGTMTNVVFYVDQQVIGAAAVSPFTATWSNVISGAHRLLALGKDNAGNAYTSAPVMIAVASQLVSSNSVWKYLDNGTDQGTAWTALNFNDSSWASGPAELGYGDAAEGRPEATEVGYGPDAANKYITTYFRRAFVLADAASFTNLQFRVLKDDGAVVYLNGTEVARYNMPGGTIAYTTPASTAAGDDGTIFDPADAPASLLVEGTNILAVEIHQNNLTSSDLSFDLELWGVPVIPRNQAPFVSVVSPQNGASFLAPSSITLSADASDLDGQVTKMEFFVDGVRVGEDTSSPYAYTWSNITLGWHQLRMVATDDQGGSQTAQVDITVYDASGTPLAQITNPTANAVFDGPTNLTLTALASAPTGIANVIFQSNGTAIGNVSTSPYALVWNNATFGTNILTAIAVDAQGRRGTSAPVRIVVNAPPPNLDEPRILAVDPPAGATISNLTAIQVIFTERVIGLDAADILVNGVPATSMSGSGSNYTFITVAQPAFGTVSIRWAAGAGISDVGYPPIAFDTAKPASVWDYNLVDRSPPVITARVPEAGATVTNMSEITVTFNKTVSGVDAADLLINGAAALSLSGSDSTYSFNFIPPGSGLVNVSWTQNHGIADTTPARNPFDANGAGATWTYTLDSRTILVQSNATWLFIKGVTEASTPMNAWRSLAFNDASWSNAPAPFYYGEPGLTNAQTPGTMLTDMPAGGYSSIYMRQVFFLPNAAAATNLFLNAQCDDGFIAWINGVEVVRYNMDAGDIPYNGSAPIAINEPNNRGAAYILHTLTNLEGVLVTGTNVLAVHAFNNQPLTSSDFGMNAQLYTYLADLSLVPPTLVNMEPRPGDLYSLTSITVTFSEGVSGVNAGDLLINGAPAASVSSTTNTTYTFQFAQPAFGNVSVSWAANPGIMDLDSTPKAFDGSVAGAGWQYRLFNPNAPVVASQLPMASTPISNLTQVTVSFSKPVTGVNASDLLVNGAPATGLSGSGATYTFTFPQPSYGTISINWAGAHGVQDLSTPANVFDAAQPGNTWSYTLVDMTPPAVATQQPLAGGQVLNLTQLTVTFTEPVSGVDAADLLINGSPTTSLSGSGAVYTFTFPQPNATLVNVTWANNHGIRDLADTPNPFNSVTPGSTWFYTTVDNVAPRLVSIDPPAHATVRSLSQIIVTFTEPVTGVGTNDLLLNGSAARQVSGSGAGPYIFTYSPAATGPVEMRWATAHGISDLGLPPNMFVASEWTYQVDPNANFADKIVISEIMFNPPGGRAVDEWLELHNTANDLVNLAGWRFARGVKYTFPNVSIPGRGYLVVAADVAAFQAKYPGVTNVVGGWTGSLANSGETLELVTALGDVVKTVEYATEGDWARRDHATAVSSVAGITRNGTTATVDLFDHGFTGNDQVLISGADQPEYNGRFTVSGINVGTFNITVNGAPATPATGTIAVRQVLDNGQTGWTWFCPADEFGSSLELINAAMPNGWGQNWLSSSNLLGTPGRGNSVAGTNAAPFIREVTHFPPVPRSVDPVTITARVRDELSNGVQNVTLFYRNHSTRPAPAFSSASMFDDGAHSDGVAQDGLYGAVLPAQANGTVMEFYVQATDTMGFTRTWPAPAWETNNTFGQLANALYQVDDETITSTMPSVRLVLTDTERAVFPPSDRNGNAEMNCTMISVDGTGTEVRYNCGVRVRGAGTRGRTPTNNRLNIPNDNRWNGLRAVNLNSQYIHSSLVGNVLAQKAGMPATDAHVVQYRINGVNPAPITAPVNGGGNGAGWGTYLMIEPVSGDLASELYPEDDGGNVYRASTGNHNANLTYIDNNPLSYLARGYFKTSNRTENDYSDLINLCYAFSQVTSEADYFQAISTNVNVREWMTYFAVGSLVNFGETALFNGRGDDYAMYRGEKDPRFVVLGHDFDTIFGQGDTGPNYYPINTNSSIYIMMNPPNANANVPVLRRFMTNANFAPIFFAELKRLCDTVFHPSQLNPLLDQLLTGWGVGPSQQIIADMKNYAANRRSVVLSQIPLALTVNTTLAQQNGYLTTTTPSVTLFGASHAIDTRKVLVNGSAAAWTAWEARWTNTVTLRPGNNRVLVQSLNSNDVEFARATVEIWYDDASVQNVSGTVASDTTWSSVNGPYQVTTNLTVASGATLTIQSGTTVYLDSGVNITVANGGRLLAEGTATAPIRFTRAPGSATSWGGIVINGAANSPETRIAYAHIEFNGAVAIHSASGTVFLDHLTFGTTTRQYLSLDSSSFVVQDCVFPTPTASFEMVHGSAGIKSGGRGLFLRNFFGAANGYNDVIDFTGGNRPGPIVQFINNVFMGSGDDVLDLDSTDAWVQGNIFMHIHKNGSPDSASAVSGGADTADTSQVTMIGNIFYDCDQAAMAKQGNFFTLINNTIVRQNRQGGTDTDAAVVCMADDGTVEAAGMYLEGNIVYNAEKLVRNQTAALVTFTNNFLPLSWSGPGGNNSSTDPLLAYIPQLAETANFASWAEAQVMWQWFSLQTGSPAAGSGPNALDAGGVIPWGVSLSGEPASPTRQASAILRVGVNRTGNGIPTAGYPNGAGFTHYRWRLDGGSWSAETPIANPIILNGLVVGPHSVDVIGKSDAGYYQNVAFFGSVAGFSKSRTWIVNPDAPMVRLNELLAANASTPAQNGTPDLIELANLSSTPVDLAGMRLTDDPANPDKFIFPAGASIPAMGYLVVYADNPDGSAGYHLGFSLNQNGDSVYLYDSAEEGGALMDSITFGPQLADLSIGRLADGAWALTIPTFGAVNRAAATGAPSRLRINEWLAIGQAPFDTDFIELYNADALPVNLGGLYLSDELVGWPAQHQIASLSFIPARGYLRFIADNDPNQGPLHLNFSLSSHQGGIGLYQTDLTPIDLVMYQSQWPNTSQGRTPDGGSAIVYFDQPTPGAPNPAIVVNPAGGALVINEVLANNATLVEAQRTPDWVELYNGTTNAVSLADLSLTDDPVQARRFIFGAGVQLAPGMFLRISCDNALPSGPTNTGFGLSASGGSIYLFDAPANGGSLLSSVTYGLQTADLSIGRVPDGGTNWVLTSPTPVTANAAVPTLGSSANLRVNEWMADPDSGDDWIELYNPNTLPVALGGLYLTDNLNERTKHKIAPLSFIGSGANAWQRFVADGNTGSGADHVNFALRASGEAVGLSASNGSLIDGFAFTAQAVGVSEGRFPDGSTNVVRFPGTASPGDANYRWLTTVAINETLTHTDEPLEDAIELVNLTGQSIDIGGWWLSDDAGTLRKYQIPALRVLPPYGFTVIYEAQFTNREMAAIPFALSSSGDEVVLSAATNSTLTGFRAHVKFGPAANGVSFGRYLTSEGREEFVAMSQRTFGVDDPATLAQFRQGTGATNAYPRVGPVVISEIMYHPPDLGTNDNVRDEFIELHNITTVPVTLYDVNYPSNSWHLRDAVDYEFPAGTIVAPGAYLLVVSFDPVNNPAALNAFRAQYQLDLSVPIVGPYRGKLANGTGELELRRPDAPNTNDVPYILVERIQYADSAPWPAEADGTGMSLQRTSDLAYANDPGNWGAGNPTPGPQASPLDSDGDGMPNQWEITHNLDPYQPGDANLDSDGDGLSNFNEYRAGTDPRNSSSVLEVVSITVPPGGANVVLGFNAQASLTYIVEATEALGTIAWREVSRIEAASTNRIIQLPIPASGNTTLYRLRLP